MEKLFTLLSIIVITTNFTNAANVTFKVDMSAELVSNNVIIAGNFNDFNDDGNVDNPALPQWSDAALILGEEGNGIYSITLNLVEGDYQFQFLNGVGGWEAIEGDCTTDDVRTVSVGSDDVEVGPYCFATCETECVTNSLPVTFRVDMSDQFVSPNGVSIMGDFASEVGFNDWIPGQIILTDDDGDDIYTVTFDEVPPGTYVYKYTNGINFGDDEDVPTECNAGGNRSFTVSGTEPIILGNIFGSCEPIKSNVTFIVDMSGEDVSPEGISVTGDFGFEAGFNDWTIGQINMNNISGSSFYTFTVQVPPGSYQYKFANGEEYEGVPETCSVNGNRFFTVDTEINIQQGPICFSTCDQECPPLIDVTFRMSHNDTNPQPWAQYVSGNFQNPEWQTNQIQLTSFSADGIYSVTVPNIMPGVYEFKFFDGASPAPDVFDFGETYDFEANGCGGTNENGSYRILDLTGVTEDIVTDIYLFNSCDLLNVGLTQIFEQKVNVYPNPVQNVVNVDFEADASKKYQLSLMDIMGKIVYQQNDVIKSNLQIQRNNLPPGTYLLNLSVENEIVASQKIILK